MSMENSGYNIIVTCTQDSTITFNCKAKRRPGLRLGSKIDVTTDHSRSAREVITFRGRTTGKEVRYSNAWFASYTPSEISLDSTQPTAVITIQSAGGTTSLPEVADALPGE